MSRGTKVVINGTYGGFELSERAKIRLGELGACASDIKAWHNGSDCSNPLLVQVVEELGTAASTNGSQLVVDEVPSNVEWKIFDYDGSEHVCWLVFLSDPPCRCLGIALAQAAALCLAFEMGLDRPIAGGGWLTAPDEPAWMPGCGRRAI